MTRDKRPELCVPSGQYFVCGSCERPVGSIFAFHKHRYGGLEPNRRCRTDAEMLAKDMFRGEDGVWQAIELTGDRNQCPGCRRYFNSTFAFEKHRVGSYEPNERRCLTDAEMLAKGMVRGNDGFWRGEADKRKHVSEGQVETRRRSPPSA